MAFNHINIKFANIYFTLITLLGLFLFIIYGDISFNSLSDWVIGYALIGAVLLLIHFKILLPPEGNALSMDSAIYLACVFTYGVETTLTVLFFASVIHLIFYRKDAWWIHIFNFALYSLMIVAASYIFLGLGGTVGSVDSSNLIAYIISLSIYFLLNVLLIGIFFFLYKRISLITALKGMLRGTLESYISTMLLAIVLSFLLESATFFGLFLFIGISLLLSFTFRQHFELYKEVSNKANIDHLTGLYNHGYFKEKLEKKINRIKQLNTTIDAKVSLAIIDLDDFKKYNDTYGHLKGDKLLTFFGELLVEKASDRNYTVARYGGEEFVILMPDTSVLEASSFIDCLRKEVNDTYFEGVEILPYGCLSFSAGISEYKSEMANSAEFLSNADEAMYYAKSQGKNNTHLFGDEVDNFSIEKPMEEIEQQLKLLLGKDIYTYRHSKRVFKYAVEFCKYLSLSDAEKKILMLGALIHDIGKIEVPRTIINKTDKLTSEEWEMVKNHVIWGKDIISTNDKFKELVPLVELHHERYDGKGYPHGLKGENIPKLARILCIIDSFDAMTTERPYQQTKSYKDALIELKECSGTQFDPNFVPLFIEYIEKKYILSKDESAS